MGLVPSCTAATAVAAITAVVVAVPVPLASTALAALRQRLLQSVHQHYWRYVCRTEHL